MRWNRWWGAKFNELYHSLEGAHYVLDVRP